MASVMNMETRPGRSVYPEPSFEELWMQAEELGRVSLEMSMFGNTYKAEIAFRSLNGSSIFARGENKDKFEAMKSAIREAVSLGKR